MKSKITALLSCAVLCLSCFDLYAAGSTARPRSGTDGLHLTGANADAWAFGSATPAAQSAATVTAYAALVAHGVIASGSLDYSLQHKTISLTAANLIAMYAAPVEILPAPGAGKTILVTKLAIKVTYTTTDFTGGGAVIFQYDSTANGGGTQALDSTLAATLITHSGGGAVATAISARNGAVLSSVVSTTLQNKGIYISNATAAFAAGTGVAVADVWYVVQ